MIIPDGTLEPTGHCHACGAELTTTRYYCNMRCASLVPPRLAHAMTLLGHTDARECILRTLRTTRSVIVAADMLGVDPTVLGRCIKNHGIKREVVWS